MQFSTLAVSLFACSTMAFPLTEMFQRRGIVSDIKGAASDVGNAVNKTGQQEFGANCDVTGCAAALGPAAAGCGGAAAQAFADPITDAACLATALNDVANKPEACSQCSL